MTISKYLVNNTIRLRIEVTNLNNEPIFPDNIYFRVYDNDKVPIFEKKLDEGVNFIPDKKIIFYDYTFNDLGEFYYGFEGKTCDKKHSKRKKVEIVFSEDELE